MKTLEQTDRMIRWFHEKRVLLCDLAVLRGDGTFISDDSCELDASGVERCLPWVRFENAHGADVFVRPARGHRWPVVLLDDVSARQARVIASHYTSLVVRTSGMRQGGCHLWLQASQALDEASRAEVQRYLARCVGADPGSISGEHWGRLAGTKNYKRSGVWVNVIESSLRAAWDVRRMHERTAPEQPQTALLQAVPPVGPRRGGAGPDRDESVAEFAWCCHRLREGAAPDAIAAALSRRACERGKRESRGLCQADAAGGCTSPLAAVGVKRK